MSITRLQQARQMYSLGQRVGGIMGSNNGSMLVTPTKDGSRPGYYGPDAGHENDPGQGSNASGEDGRPNMADIAGPVTGPVDMSHFGDTGDIVQADFTPYNQRPDTITNFFDNYKANVQSNPFNLGTIGAIKTLAQTAKAKDLLGFGSTIGPVFNGGDGVDETQGIMDINIDNNVDDADGDGDVDQDDFIFKYFDETGETLQTGSGGVKDLMTLIENRISNLFS